MRPRLWLLCQYDHLSSPFREVAEIFLGGFGRCCPVTDDCCENGYCSPPQGACCIGGVCPAGYDCCLNGCAPSGSQCCDDGTYCSSGFECCIGGCALSGAMCCADGKWCLAGNECVVLYSNGEQVCCTNTHCTAYVIGGVTVTGPGGQASGTKSSAPPTTLPSPTTPPAPATTTAPAT
jgi:hypothetical protein